MVVVVRFGESLCMGPEDVTLGLTTTSFDISVSEEAAGHRQAEGRPANQGKGLAG